jgi:hypothetical protein
MLDHECEAIISGDILYFLPLNDPSKGRLLTNTSKSTRG